MHTARRALVLLSAVIFRCFREFKKLPTCTTVSETLTWPFGLV